MTLRPFGIALLFAFAVPDASAQWWDSTKANAGQPGFRQRGSAPAAPVETNDYATWQRASGEGVRAVMNELWTKPDRMHDEFLASGARSAHGLSYVEAMQAGWDAQFDTPDPGPLRQFTLDKWAAAAPDSRFRRLVEAIGWQRQAWVARGGGLAGAVPGESAKLFRERLALATKALEETGPAGRESPIWYWVALVVAGSSGQPAKALDALHDEAAAKFPHYHSIHYTRMNYLLPQWGGSFAQVDAFVNRVVERTREKDGEAFYAWLYVDVARKTDGDYLKVTKATWPRMKRGFEDMVARYPDPWNRSLYATCACRARDRETTARLLGELGPQAQLGEHSPGYTTESCRRFASGAS